MDNPYFAREPPLERPRNMSYGRPLFPVIPAENAPSPPPYEEPPSAQARKLQLRKARFRGLVVPTRNITPVGARKSSINNETSGEVQHGSPYEYGSLERRQRRTLSNDLGILQEVTNSSLRRKRNIRPDISTIFEPEATFQEEPELLTNTSLTNLLDAPRIATANTPRRRNPRVVSKDNLNVETTRYIEHLESQMAALQTQLQCLTSPSTTKTQSAKLRAMNSESSLLKQAVADWESKFHDRIQEQLKQHEIVVSKLKAEIRQLEKELELNHDKMQELRTQSDDKTRQLVVVESANYDLERRLEFMSELLASTSGRLDLHGDPRLGASKRGGPGRPKSVGPLRIPTPVLQQFSPKRNDRARRLQDPSRTPESPVHTGDEEVNPWDRLGASTRSFDTSPETASVVSENILVESVSMSPGNRRSFMLSQSVNSEQDGKSRPTRRMRRFYTGSTGPRSLILPTTTHAGSFPTSAPILESRAPSFHSSMTTPREGLGFKLPISPERPAMHKRSATWDDRESHSVRARRVGGITPIAEAASPFSYRLPPPAREDEQHTPPTPTYNNPTITSQDATPLFSNVTPLFSDDDAQLMANRAISLSSVRGRNLFDELNRMKHDDENEDVPSTHPSSSPFRSFSGPASYAVTPLPASPQSSSTCEPGPQISPTPAPSAFTAANTAAKRSTTTTPSSSSTTSPSSLQSATTIIARTPSLIDRLLSLLALPSVKTVMSNAWSMFSLARPVLEFRFWLIRLLLGDLKKKHARLMLLRDAAAKGRVVSGSGSGRSSVQPGSSAGAVGLGISHGRSVMLATAAAAAAVSPKARLMEAFEENNTGGSLRPRRTRQNNNHNNTVDEEENSDDSDDVLTIDDFAAPVNEEQTQTSRLAPVAWVKLSMTLVFAVGVAIKDGPASLFQAQRRGFETVEEEEND